jgi:hypothetical protein
VDYTKFLNKKEHVVLAYLGGAHVFGKDRRMRVDGERPALGFHRFEVSGRNARSLEPVDTPDLGELPKARGHLVEGWLVSSSAPAGTIILARLSLLPEDEPSPLAIARARIWYSGDLLFESLDFDGEPEEQARLRLEQRAPLGDLKGVAATLRTAYGIALALAVGRRLGTPIAVREAASHAMQLAGGGEPAARELFARIERDRAVEQERAWARALTVGRPLARVRGPRGASRNVVPTLDNATERAEAALDGADARMLATRRLGGASPRGNHLEVAFQFMGERFLSVVDAISLQVIDSGVCLAGEDDLVTLDSLPGVIREAIDTDRLVITRR